MKNKRNKKSIVLDAASRQEQLLREAIKFEWPLKEGHGSFCAETQDYPRYLGLWERGICIGIFHAPTEEDIRHNRFSSGRYWAKLEVYRVRISKRGIRTGKTILYREIFFYEDDPKPPSHLVAILLEQVNPYSQWKRIV